MLILKYELSFDIFIDDWRVLAMQFLEYDIVCTASRYKIFGYTPEDLAQESRLHIWTNLHKYDPNRAGIRTWGILVIRTHLNHLEEKATKTRKRKDYLCESIHDMEI